MCAALRMQHVDGIWLVVRPQPRSLAETQSERMMLTNKIKPIHRTAAHTRERYEIQFENSFIHTRLTLFALSEFLNPAARRSDRADFCFFFLRTFDFAVDDLGAVSLVIYSLCFSEFEVVRKQ